MPKYLRSERDRKSAILDDAPDTRFYFESQRYSDIPGYQNRRVKNLVQTNGYAAREVRKNENLSKPIFLLAAACCGWRGTDAR